MLSSGVKDTDHGANSCQIAAPRGDYSRPFAKVRRQLRESGSLFVQFCFIYLTWIFLSSTPLFCFCSIFFPATFFRLTSGNNPSKALWMMLETICQLSKTESWRWIPEVEVTPFIRQFIRGTCQGRPVQIWCRARQIRITKTATCLLKWSFPACVSVKWASRGLDWQLLGCL